MQPATADTGSPRAARARTLTSVPADNLFSSFSSATLTSLDEVAGVTQTQVSWRSQPQADNSMADGVAMSTEVPHLVQAPTNSLGSEQADQEVATTSSRGARYRSTSDPRGASSDSEFRAEHTSRPERRNLPNLWRATTNWFTRSRSPSPRIRSATGGEGGLRAVIDRVRSRNEERREASREGVVPSSTRSRLSFPMTRTSAVQAQDASRDIVGTEWGFAPEESTRTMTAVTRSSPPAGTHILLPAPRTDRRRSALTSSGRQSGERVYADRRRVSFRSPGQQSNLPSEASRDEELRSSVRGAARYSGSLAGPSLAPQTVPESDQTTGQAETALQAALRRARNDFPRLYDLAEAGRSSQIGLRLVPPELNTTLYGSDAVRAVRAAAIDAERHIEDILAQLSQPLQGHGAGAPFRIHRRQLDQHVASACRAVREELERCSAEALRNHLLNPYNLAYLMSTQVVRLAEETLRAYTPMWGWYELFRYWRFVLEQRVSLLRLWISTVDRESWRQNAHGIVLLTGGVGLVQGSLLEMESAIGVQPDLI
ncbi:hypothetical protein IE81DRAFT_183925 [Ceraceosorus guamensis]|uniref:Uncharacterized protein n=1 Tax=Ceraceosorus guamensis TaxID=1522189 RepID=A0A316VV77_9BASI|nr:hypothetical protein IE81DRAFT_183925 [Ceraceosorus guamensis]PWN41184.1 hypothetical protein IE81DRAFT_183925 [Ceraceosorus guamensis]